MSHGDGKILVAPTNLILKHYFNGYLQYEFDRRLDLSDCHWRSRDAVEQDRNYKQIIPYIVVQDMVSRTVMTYKREEAGHEGRLHDCWSIGFGGHIKEATDKREYHEASINAGLMREFNEELNIELNQPHTRPLDRLVHVGYVNDDRNSVGRVHLGIVHFLKLTRQEVEFASPREVENRDNWGWMTAEWLFEHYSELETWSQLVLPAATPWYVPRMDQ